jgi:hypothetical protein
MMNIPKKVVVLRGVWVYITVVTIYTKDATL